MKQHNDSSIRGKFNVSILQDKKLSELKSFSDVHLFLKITSTTRQDFFVDHEREGSKEETENNYGIDRN